MFGWFGKSNIPNLPSGLPYDPSNPATFVNDYFQRIGLDARWKYFRPRRLWPIFFGHDPFPGYLQDEITPAGNTNHLGLFVEADYMIKPWIMSFVRYEQVKIFNPGLVAFSTAPDGTLISGGEEARVVPGITFAIRQNLDLSTELYLDVRGVNVASGYPEATDQWITSLQFAF